jgi:hypothetical protein
MRFCPYVFTLPLCQTSAMHCPPSVADDALTGIKRYHQLFSQAVLLLRLRFPQFLIGSHR